MPGLGRLALASACLYGHRYVARCLLEHGAPPEQRDEYGRLLGRKFLEQETQKAAGNSEATVLWRMHGKTFSATYRCDLCLCWKDDFSSALPVPKLLDLI